MPSPIASSEMIRAPGWQEGYSAFTVSHSGLEDVRHYVRTQKQHHRQRDYKEELLTMLKLNEVNFDERYVFVG